MDLIEKLIQRSQKTQHGFLDIQKAVNGVRVPRKSQVKISSFFEAKLPLCRLGGIFLKLYKADLTHYAFSDTRLGVAGGEPCPQRRASAYCPTLAAWYDKISGILPGSVHLRAIIKDVERTWLGILTRAVNDIHLWSTATA